MGDLMDLLGGAGGNLLDPGGNIVSGMNSKKEDSSTTSTPNLPPSLQALVDQTAGRQGTLQDSLWAQMMPGSGLGYGPDPIDRRTLTQEEIDAFLDAQDDDGTSRMRRISPSDRFDSGDDGRAGFDLLNDDRSDDFNFSPKVKPHDDGDSDGGGGNGNGNGMVSLQDFLSGFGQQLNPYSAITDGDGGGGGGGMTSLMDLLNGRFGDYKDPNPAVTDGDPLDGGTVPVTSNTPGDWISPSDWQMSEDGILGDNSRTIVGTNRLLEDAIAGIYGLDKAPEEFDAARGLLDEMRGVSQRKVSGEGLQDDAAYKAAQDAFETAMVPLIENQAALSGLGRSTAVGNATAQQQATVMMPLIQDFMGRQERGIDRELGAMGQQFSGLAGLGDRSYGRKTDQIGQLFAAGDYGRQIGQERADSKYNDFLRKAGMFEGSLNGPTGLFGSDIGGTTTSHKSGKG